MEGHAISAPISRLPLVTVLDAKHRLKDIPVCQVIQLMVQLIVFIAYGAVAWICY